MSDVRVAFDAHWVLMQLKKIIRLKDLSIGEVKLSHGIHWLKEWDADRLALQFVVTLVNEVEVVRGQHPCVEVTLHFVFVVASFYLAHDSRREVDDVTQD